MTTANGEPFTVEGAVKTIQRWETLETGLQLRTEGITSIVWGLVTAGLFVSYMCAGVIVVEAWWFDVLWVPWIAAGVAATMLIWRSAHLTAKKQFPRTSWAIFFWIFCTWLATWTVAWTVFFLTRSQIHLLEPGFATLVLGLVSAIVPSIPTARFSAPSRRMNLVVGVLALAAVLVMAVVPYASDDYAYLVQTLAGVVLIGGGWFLGGAWLMAKG